MSTFKLYYLGAYDSRLGGKSYSQWAEGEFYALEYDGKIRIIRIDWHNANGWDYSDALYPDEDGIRYVFGRYHKCPPREKWREISPDSLCRTERELISHYCPVDIRTEADVAAKKAEEAERAAAAKAAAEAAAEARRIEQIEEAKKRKAYGKLCGVAARKVDLPFDIVLTVGPELAQELKDAMSNLGTADELDLHELLWCGIARRKSAIFRLLPEISDELYDKIEYMGQIHSNRLADFIADHCPKYS